MLALLALVPVLAYLVVYGLATIHVRDRYPAFTYEQYQKYQALCEQQRGVKHQRIAGDPWDR